jgi:hypothetical protein
MIISYWTSICVEEQCESNLRDMVRTVKDVMILKGKICREKLLKNV